MGHHVPFCKKLAVHLAISVRGSHRIHALYCGSDEMHTLPTLCHDMGRSMRDCWRPLEQVEHDFALWGGRPALLHWAGFGLAISQRLGFSVLVTTSRDCSIPRSWQLALVAKRAGLPRHLLWAF